MLQFLLLNTFLCYLLDAKLYPIAVRLPLKYDPPAADAALWPKPLEHLTTKNYMFLNRDSFKFIISESVNACEEDLLKKAVERYMNILFPPKLTYAYPSKSDLKFESIKIEISNSNAQFMFCPIDYYPLIEDTDQEKYRIVISRESQKSSIEGNTIWGALRAIETFSQLIYNFNETNKLAINETIINDKPRFAYRGIMLDTSRHYLPIALIKKHLDAAFYNKLNVFHWHITDDQSFPFKSDVYPLLWQKGAYTHKHLYTKEDIKELIEFARIRGIRIIPEFDSPGHVASWGLGYEQLLTVCYNNTQPLVAIYNKHAKREIMNPISNFTYEFMRNILSEIKSTFVDPFIHMGMDEVYYSCWESNPEIKEWMIEKGFTKTKDVEQYYMERVLKLANNLDYKVTVWQDVFDNNVDVFKDTIVQVWKSVNNVGEPSWQEYLSKVTFKGYKTILSSPWYLNYIKYGRDWEEFYVVEPLAFNGTLEQKSLVLGGEMCMWGEYVDGTNSLARMWPRGSAVAERLWSVSSVNDIEEAKYRLDEHRCRMLRRGLDAQPILNGYCGDFEAYFENSLLNHPLFNYNNEQITQNSISIVLPNSFSILIIQFSSLVFFFVFYY